MCYTSAFTPEPVDTNFCWLSSQPPSRPGSQCPGFPNAWLGEDGAGGTALGGLPDRLAGGATAADPGCFVSPLVGPASGFFYWMAAVHACKLRGTGSQLASPEEWHCWRARALCGREACPRHTCIARVCMVSLGQALRSRARGSEGNSSHPPPVLPAAPAAEPAPEGPAAEAPAPSPATGFAD